MGDLEQFYSGDAAWSSFATLFVNDFSRCIYKDELKKALGGHEELAAVIYGSFGETALQWISQSVPALSGLSPLECLESEAGLKRLRTMLMRMPR